MTKGRKIRSRPSLSGDERLRRWILGATVALYLARPLHAGDSAAQEGYGVMFVMLWILLAAVWLVTAIRSGKLALRFGAIDTAIVLLILWHTVSALWAMQHESPRSAMNVMWEWIALGVGFVLLRQLIVSASEARAVVAAMIGMALALSAIGYHQYFVSMPRDRELYERIKDDPRAMMSEVGEWYPPNSPERRRFEDRLASTEPTAQFALANSLGGFLAPWLVLALGIGLWGWPEDTPGGVRWGSVLIIGSAVVGCLLLTKSRSAVLATGVGAALLWPAYRGGKRRAGLGAVLGILALLAVMVIAAIAVGGLDKQVLSQAGRSFGYRLQYWQATVPMIWQRPLFGCGPGQYQFSYTQYKLPQASEEVRDPHNFLLEVWATAGTPAALLLLVACAGLLIILWRGQARISSAADSKSKPRFGDTSFIWGSAAGAVLLASVVGFASGFPLDTIEILILLAALVAGLVLLHGWIQDGQLPPALILCGIVALLVNLLAAGGIGFPGVAGSLWLLAAVGLTTVRHGSGTRLCPRYGVVIAAAITGLVAVLCFVTTYRPVLTSDALLRKLANAEELRQEELLEKALLADPYSLRAARLSASYYFHRWERYEDPQALKSFSTVSDRAVQMAPRSSVTWAQRGRWYFMIFERTGNSEYRKRAIEAHRRAVELYPNAALHHAELAMVLAETGQLHEARPHARRALDLDQQTRLAGHEDRLLSDGLLQQMRHLINQSN